MKINIQTEFEQPVPCYTTIKSVTLVSTSFSGWEAIVWWTLITFLLLTLINVIYFSVIDWAGRSLSITYERGWDWVTICKVKLFLLRLCINSKRALFLLAVCTWRHWIPPDPSRTQAAMSSCWLIRTVFNLSGTQLFWSQSEEWAQWTWGFPGLISSLEVCDQGARGINPTRD